MCENVSGEEIVRKHRMQSALQLYPFAHFSFTSFVVPVCMWEDRVFVCYTERLKAYFCCDHIHQNTDDTFLVENFQELKSNLLKLNSGIFKPEPCVYIFWCVND